MTLVDVLADELHVYLVMDLCAGPKLLHKIAQFAEAGVVGAGEEEEVDYG